MKSFYILLAPFLLLTVLTFGQGASGAKSSGRPAVTKGYYSIGDHSKKLYRSSWPVPDTFITPNITKGYYSMQKDNGKLPEKAGWFKKHVPRPVTQKGYYSIGNNAPASSNDSAR